MLVKFKRNGYVCPGFIFMKTICICIFASDVPLDDVTAFFTVYTYIIGSHFANVISMLKAMHAEYLKRIISHPLKCH